MCLLALLAFAVFMLITIFVKSAIVLLPWTVTASVMGGLIGLAVGKLALKQYDFQRGLAQTISFALSLVMTYALGYLGWLLIPPVAKEQSIENWWDFLFEMPEPKLTDLWNMFPVHLGIAGIVAGLIAVSWLSRESETIVITD